jgi:hypothetical protein
VTTNTVDEPGVFEWRIIRPATPLTIPERQRALEAMGWKFQRRKNGRWVRYTGTSRRFEKLLEHAEANPCTR